MRGKGRKKEVIFSSVCSRVQFLYTRTMYHGGMFVAFFLMCIIHVCIAMFTARKPRQ